MLGSYKKIAYKQCNVEFSSGNTNISIPFEVNFTPTRILARITGMFSVTLDSKYTNTIESASGLLFQVYGSNIKFDKNTNRVRINIAHIGFNSGYKFYVKEIILIE